MPRSIFCLANQKLQPSLQNAFLWTIQREYLIPRALPTSGFLFGFWVLFLSCFPFRFQHLKRQLENSLFSASSLRCSSRLLRHHGHLSEKCRIQTELRAGGKQEENVLGESRYHGASAFVAWFAVVTRTQKITASELLLLKFSHLLKCCRCYT